MEKTLSIIIPAYNVSSFIEQGLDSLINDRSILPLLDIIIVNDGSNDNTLEIINKYKFRFPESITVIDKENGGHGSGINIGIKNAKGTYLKVLDGDDWFNTEGLIQLIYFIETCLEYPDIIVNPYKKVWEDGKIETVSYPEIKEGITVGYAEVNKFGYTLSLPSITIRSDIFRLNNIPDIDEKISYDDMEYILYPVPYINKIVFLKKTIYEYRLGLSGQSMNLMQMIKRLPMHTRVVDALADYYDKHKTIFNSEAANYYINEFVNTFATNFQLRLLSGIDKQEMITFVKKYNSFPLKSAKNKKMRLLLNINFIGFTFIQRLALKRVKVNR
ncbi:glycosyltransferase family 2 protein [Erysipelotrichaceae bacterium AF15-26LB]|nr:glycosyltransferase family 2 protein [[Clostridium] innocuum]RJV90004.1 glycosyltransferase family 2 protein [Erysipelotrichaceae bacterium AF19-24AC]RJV90551.1 glycosyltransferase family 2 protein [Erysipelotrichaceae bacterium AF15-26LB]